MKKIRLLISICLLTAMTTLPALAISTSDIYIINNTGKNLMVGPRTQTEVNLRDSGAATLDKPTSPAKQVGVALTIPPSKPGDTGVKIASLDRDQKLRALPLAFVPLVGGPFATVLPGGTTTISFMANDDTFSFKSSVIKQFQMFSTLTCTHVTSNGIWKTSDSKLPITEIGLEILPRFKFGKLYQDVVMKFSTPK
jgi:hypothetical protein